MLFGVLGVVELVIGLSFGALALVGASSGFNAVTILFFVPQQ